MKDLHDKAKKYALKLLSYRGRSEKELEERLRRKGFAEAVVSLTINHLKHLGLVNDRALATAMKMEAIKTKLLGQNGAKRFMIMRGIPREIVSSMFSPDEKEDIENPKRLIEKKLNVMKGYPPDTIKRRLYNLLLRKGYSLDTIKTVLRGKNLDINEVKDE